MFRSLTSLGMLVALAAIANAQPGTSRNWPYVQGQPLPAASIPQGAQAGTVYFPVALPTGWGMGWGYQTYNPWTGYGYSYGGLLPTTPTTPAPAVEERPRRSEPTVALSAEYPATLAIQLPEAAEVWVDGKKVSGVAKAEQVLTSPVLKPDQKYAFNVKARWTRESKTYETTRTVTLGSGDHSRLLVVSGDEVRE